MSDQPAPQQPEAPAQVPQPSPIVVAVTHQPPTVVPVAVPHTAVQPKPPTDRAAKVMQYGSVAGASFVLGTGLGLEASGAQEVIIAAINKAGPWGAGVLVGGIILAYLLTSRDRAFENLITSRDRAFETAFGTLSTTHANERHLQNEAFRTQVENVRQAMVGMASSVDQIRQSVHADNTDIQEVIRIGAAANGEVAGYMRAQLAREAAREEAQNARRTSP